MGEMIGTTPPGHRRACPPDRLSDGSKLAGSTSDPQRGDHDLAALRVEFTIESNHPTHGARHMEVAAPEECSASTAAAWRSAACFQYSITRNALPIGSGATGINQHPLTSRANSSGETLEAASSIATRGRSITPDTNAARR